MSDLTEQHRARLGQVKEPIQEPELPIIDPHHHLWKEVIGFEVPPYLLKDLWEDTGSGHNVKKTVFIECGAEYYSDGEEHLKPVGETVFVQELANASRGHDKAEISGIVAFADLTHTKLEEVLEAHQQAAGGIFKGIRHAGSFARHPEALLIKGRAVSFMVSLRGLPFL